jgi:hypothetical protein
VAEGDLPIDIGEHNFRSHHGNAIAHLSIAAGAARSAGKFPHEHHAVGGLQAEHRRIAREKGFPRHVGPGHAKRARRSRARLQRGEVTAQTG